MISSLTQITQERLINLRWLSVLAMVAAALVSPNILGSTALMPKLLAFATLIAAINTSLKLIVLFSSANDEGLPMLSPLIQLVFDLISWACYIYLSGGATNPLISIFLPLVAIGAIVLNTVQAWFLGGAAILSYTFLWRHYQPLDVSDAQTAARLHLLGMWLVFVVSAVVVIWFILQVTKGIQERDAALAQAREQAIRNDWLVSMGSLAAGAAHELSTPLGTMNILIDEWLDDDGLAASQRADYQLMQAQIETCKRALSQLTQRAGSPRSDHLRDVSSASSLNATLAAWSSVNPTATLIVNIAPGLNDRGQFLERSIERAIANLLDNALAARASHITLNARLEEEHMVIQIDDDGHGISARALQSFYDGEPATAPCGMGVGLLLSRTAVERQGGKLTLERLPQQGTRACLDLPLNDDEEISSP